MSGSDTHETTDWLSAGRPRDASGLPRFIGRYRVVGTLGQGGFGKVFLAQDDDLDRAVAIKVPRPERVSKQEDLEAYLDEARILASLDHPNIVPVYDVGRTDDGLCFVVSKVIEWTSLAHETRRFRSNYSQIAELIAAVADALRHAHQKGLVHRDVKPDNILIDAAGKPYLADFGIALREEDLGNGPGYAGTPAYMSPEQARGEGHRVDGRTDIFSLGVVLYELLTGRHPFGTGDRSMMMTRIATFEPRPPRQFDDTIPREIERICLRAMARRISDRYGTAKDLADDLRLFAAESKTDTGPAVLPAPPAVTSPAPVTATSEWRRARVVPKGLRSFDANDADFFLDLLPGPRDRNGLSEAIRFWKTRIERVDADETFPVGLIYGPSGCGKSSLVKAGLLPRLAPHVVPVYLEATTDLEARLHHRLERACPKLGSNLRLPDMLAAIRRGDGLPPGSKILIVLDQFEQWLHANRQGLETELVLALRQCDGERVQALVMVRDDFWMMSSRFMRELEVHVVEGSNAAAVDLFTPAHARKVLAAFGSAFGVIPWNHDELTSDQNAFLDRAVAALTEEGKLIPVRLALFAEMVKSRSWTADTLRKLGGAVGVGATFLDETFAAATAPPEHRLHLKAVRKVLGALLPDPGADIKGHKRSRSELLAASGYEHALEDFDDLIRILDSETRLLTPMASDIPRAEVIQPGKGSRIPVEPVEKNYQLTHDYLVPSIREWLDRAQRETRRGRAEIKLAERTALWTAKPERKQLPSFLEWLRIRTLTKSSTWTAAQQEMMRGASRYHLGRAGCAAVLLAVLVLAALAIRDQAEKAGRAAHTRGLVARLLDASVDQVPGIIGELDRYRRDTDPLLMEVVRDPATSPARRLRARLALLPVDRGQASFLCPSLLEADPDLFRVLRDSLQPHRQTCAPRLWEELEAPDRDPKRRFRAAAALARFDPESPRWGPWTGFVTDQLVAQPSLLAMEWVDALRPIKDRLVPPLSALFRDHSEPQATPSALTSEILAEYTADQPELLADLLGDAEPTAFGPIFARLKLHEGRALAALESVLAEAPPAKPADPPDLLAKRHANAAIAILRMGKGERVWPLLKAAPEPAVRSFLIVRLAAIGGDPAVLVERLAVEPEPSVRAGLLLALGGFGKDQLPEHRRKELAPRVRKLYGDDPDAAVHAASGWLLRSWGLRELDKGLANGPGPADRRWSLNSLGQTMVLIPAPIEFRMGSPENERGRRDNERLHKVQIPHSYEIAATEVTIGQFEPFLEAYPAMRAAYPRQADASPESPQTRVSWYDAAKYCNWLSAKEDIPREQWCYEPNEKGQFAEGMKLASNLHERKGYRLSTEAEWEYACRAGSITSHYFGESDELMPRFVRFSANSDEHASPVGKLLPNAFGLFDMHGNVFEWCHERFGGPSPSQPHAPGIRADVVLDSTRQVVRGGGFLSSARRIRSAARFVDYPYLCNDTGGFRISRSRPEDRSAKGAGTPSNSR